MIRPLCNEVRLTEYPVEGPGTSYITSITDTYMASDQEDAFSEVGSSSMRDVFVHSRASIGHTQWSSPLDICARGDKLKSNLADLRTPKRLEKRFQLPLAFHFNFTSHSVQSGAKGSQLMFLIRILLYFTALLTPGVFFGFLLLPFLSKLTCDHRHWQRQVLDGTERLH